MARLLHSKRINSDFNWNLLDDASIENKQALDMIQIYSDIQIGRMDAFASVILNNPNVMRNRLTLISNIFMIPTLIASVFGMNVPYSFESLPCSIPTIIISSLLLSIIGFLYFESVREFHS